MENPFRPGMGRVPPAMAGRDHILERYAVWFGSKNSYGEVALIEGHRGVGKTSLMKVIGSSAASAKWAHIHLEARSDATFEDLLAGIDLDRLVSATSGLLGRGTRVKELSAELKAWGFGIAVGGKGDSAERPTPSIALARFAHRCDENGMGLLLTVDEIQRASRSLCQSLGELANRSHPIMHLWAGLPGTRTALQAREVTAAERARDFQLGTLTPGQTREALLGPFTDRGITVTDSIAEQIVELAAGYPYFVQVYGDELWTEHHRAGAPGTIDAAIGERAISSSRMTTDRFYEDRLSSISPRARDAIETLAQMPQPSSSTALAEHLDLSPKGFSPRRSELLASGLVTSPTRGTLELSFPGIAHYLTAH